MLDHKDLGFSTTTARRISVLCHGERTTSLRRHSERIVSLVFFGIRANPAMLVRVLGFTLVSMFIATNGCGSFGTGNDPTTVAFVEVTPDSTTLFSVGTTRQFSATAWDTDSVMVSGTTFDWLSDNISVATVSSLGLVSAVSNGRATITASVDDVEGVGQVTVSQEVAAVVVEPAAPQLAAVGETVQLYASAYDAGSTPILGQTFDWASSDESIATVSATGLVTASDIGSASISATVSGVSDTVEVTISPAAVSVVVEPAVVELSSLGETAQLTATARDAGNEVISGKTFDWTSLDVGIVTVNSLGFVTAVANGTTMITAATDGVADTAEVTVEQEVVTVAVEPEAANLSSVGETVQLAAAALDAMGELIPGTIFDWESSVDGVATVSSSGLVTAVANGTTMITAATDGVADTAEVTVEQEVVTVTVEPATANLSSVGETVQLVAAALDAMGEVVPGVMFDWESSDDGIATVSSSGLATAVANGTATITATVGGVEGYGHVTVNTSSSGAILADHTTVNAFPSIPTTAFEHVRNNYRIFYAHTSHGSQIVSGLGILENEDANYTPPDIDERIDDLGHLGDVSWAATTRALLDANPGVYDVVMWAWCAGVTDNTEAGINIYLQTMSQLETEYPDVSFVYMTGPLDGSGIYGNNHARNSQIRAYAAAHNKILFDFNDIESYDPDGNYYPNETDGCGWCSTWCATHTCPSCSECAHSHCFNCYIKGKAFWWMMWQITQR